MIAIDTNVLLRYLLNDDRYQSAKANAIMAQHELVLISNIVLAEMVWTLTGKKYRLDAPAIADVILALFEEPNVLFEDSTVVWQALSDFRQAIDSPTSSKESALGFADALILNNAKATATSYNELFRGFYTFDVAAQRLPDVLKP